MLALLKLIPLRDWCYLAILLAVLAAFGWTYHKGEETIKAKDALLNQAAVALNLSVEHAAEINEIPIGRTYEKIITSAPVPNTGLVCHATAPVKPQTADYRPEAPYKAAALPGGGFDPSGPILTLLRDSDAQVDGLIDTIQVLKDELQGKTK